MRDAIDLYEHVMDVIEKGLFPGVSIIDDVVVIDNVSGDSFYFLYFFLNKTK